MKKIILIICLLISNKIYALTNITIDNEDLIPKFDKNIKIYNYYTNKDKIIIKKDKEEQEYILNNNEEQINIEDYIINVFKDYNKDNNKDIYLLNLNIKGYNINYNKDIYEYYIDINNVDRLDIDYELSNDRGYVAIIGNGNFNKSDNLILINVNDNYKYKIHAYKTMNVSYIKKDNNKLYFTGTKKEIVKYLLITISSIIIFSFFYLMFNRKSFYI